MIFKTKTNHKWFTLVELMVVIALISIITLSATRIDFNRSSDQQRLAIFTGEIASKIETVRNNALIGKWVGVNLETPESWEIQISDISAWSLQTTYNTGWPFIANNEYSVTPNNFYSIWNMRCLQFNNTSETISWNTTIRISGNSMELFWCSSNDFKILEFTTSYRDFTQTVRINTLSWLIEVD